MTPLPARARQLRPGHFRAIAETAVAIAMMGLCFPSVSHSQVTFEVLEGFEAPFFTGASPYAGLLQATDGRFYGTTRFGGASGRGTVFRVDATGALTTLHHFTGGIDGGYPYAGVIEAADGGLYGTTLSGGVDESGTI